MNFPKNHLMKKIYPAAIVLTLSFLSCTKHNENNELNSADLTFMEQMSLNHASEIAAAKLVASNSQSTSLKNYGNDMGTYYSNVEAELERLAASVNLDMQGSVHSQQQVERLGVLSGYSFDTAYIKSEVKTHRAMLSLFQDAFNNGNNATVKGYVHRHIDEMERNFLRADSLERHL